jgi:hypothetical protein
LSRHAFWVAPGDPPGYNWFIPVCLPGPIAGPTVLPAGFGHPHASEEARKIAEEGMTLRVQVGSGVRGTSISGQDVRDEMGVCLEPPQFVTGLARVPDGNRARDRRCGLSSTNGTQPGIGPAG